VLDLHAATGLLTWEALRRVPEGGVWALAADQGSAQALQEQAASLDELYRPRVLVGRIAELPDLLSVRGDGGLHFDAAVGRNALTQATSAERTEVARVLASLLSEGGILSLGQVVPRHTQRIYALVDLSQLPADLAERVVAAEEAIYADEQDPWVNWDAPELAADLRSGGLEHVDVQTERETAEMLVTPTLIERWFAMEGRGERPTYAQHLLGDLSPAELEQYRALVVHDLQGQAVPWRSAIAYLVARRP
jgi:putative ATPase